MPELTIPQAFELALQHHQAGRLAEAEAIYRQILAVEPPHVDALHMLGVIAGQTGRNDVAVDLIRQAIVLRPNFPEALNNAGNALSQRGRFEEAITAYGCALEFKPEDAEAHYNLGNALYRSGQLDAAIAAFHRAIAINPNFPEAHSNLGTALYGRGELDEAIVAYREAIALKPDYTEAHYSLAFALLCRGHFREGWEELEWHMKLPHLARPDLTTPQWNGEDLFGKTLLIHQEGGFGDVIHFIRYLAMVRARGVGKVIFEGGAPILSLMKIQPGIDETIMRAEPIPAHDFHCPPQSFPRVFGTGLHSIPASVPYLTVDPEKRAAWRHKLSQPPYQSGERRQFLVGLNWAGSEHQSELRSRSLNTFGPLAQVPEVTFVSLQKGKEAGQSAVPPTGMRFVDAAAEVKGFCDLAALISCLDAVASVDTSVAHLAGALGRPTWILIPKAPDFRWMNGREGSPWYPTVRLFRQQNLNSWDEPVQRMVDALRSQAESVSQRS